MNQNLKILINLIIDTVNSDGSVTHADVSSLLSRNLSMPGMVAVNLVLKK